MENESIQKLAEAIANADAIVVGAGSGLSTAAGFTYSGERFQRLFGDFIDMYGFEDMYSAGFYPYFTLEEHWAYWSRYIWCNRYEPAPKDTYAKLLKLLEGKDYFVLTTNVDHQFQLAGFPKDKLFYTQGDYGLWQCSKPCCQETYDNYDQVKRMVEEQQYMRIPCDLVPYCPHCGKPLSMNLRADSTFVEDEGWHQALERYNAFMDEHKTGKVLYLELGVGGNTPAIIKYPFWNYVASNPEAIYACVNLDHTECLAQIYHRSIILKADIHEVLCTLLDE